MVISLYVDDFVRILLYVCAFGKGTPTSHVLSPALASSASSALSPILGIFNNIRAASSAATLKLFSKQFRTSVKYDFWKLAVRDL